MADEKGCEYGRLIEVRVKALEAKCEVIQTEMKETRTEILAKLESWWPKPLGIIIVGLFTVLGALITAMAMLLTR